MPTTTERLFGNGNGKEWECKSRSWSSLLCSTFTKVKSLQQIKNILTRQDVLWSMAWYNSSRVVA